MIVVMVVAVIVAAVKNQIIASHNVIAGDKKYLLNYRPQEVILGVFFFVIILNVRLIVLVAMVAVLVVAIVAVLEAVQAVRLGVVAVVVIDVQIVMDAIIMLAHLVIIIV